MKKNKRDLLRLLVLYAIFVVTVISLSGCCPLAQSFGPRAPVIVSRYPTVVDFIDDEEAIAEELKLSEERAPLLPEYFDPFQPLVEDYRISKGDILEISVFGNSDTLVNEVIIAPDGKLYYMFLEGIEAKEKTIPEIKKILEEGLTDFFINPDVSIIPKRMANQHYLILGKVRRPGVYLINTALTLQQAIGEAGGIALGGFAGTTINIANLRNSFIVRDKKMLNVDFERLVYTDGTDQNIFIHPGDYIYIASSLVQEIFLVGEIRETKPIQYKDGLTLTAVLAGTAGTTEGWTDRAHITNVLIVRGSLDCPQTYHVNVLDILEGSARDVYLLPGDIVYVQKKPFHFGRELVRLAIESFVRAFAAEAGVHYMDKWLD